MRLARSVRGHLTIDIVKNIVEVLIDLAVPIPFDPIATPFQISSPDFVSYGILGQRVLISVELDDHLCFETDEVDDKRSDRLLPAEFESSKTTIAQSGPQLPLNPGLLASETPR